MRALVVVVLGLTVTGGVASWANGEPVGYTAWAPGQPNETTDSCAVSNINLDWEDVDCSMPLHALCERE